MLEKFYHHSIKFFVNYSYKSGFYIHIGKGFNTGSFLFNNMSSLLINLQ